ncbi:hypothetical protein KAR91_83830 [Candidatus Pacearchaeota archaeon]|nr:hypothetical protein [Candidatus Pacearchaeota archaeon]
MTSHEKRFELVTEEKEGTCVGCYFHKVRCHAQADCDGKIYKEIKDGMQEEKAM